MSRIEVHEKQKDDNGSVSQEVDIYFTPVSYTHLDVYKRQVVAIETGAFSNSALTEIVLPDTLEFIDRLAFSTCRNLEKINFPENLKYIGNLAFLGCDSLNEIELHCPNLKIMKEAFSDCNELINAILEDVYKRQQLNL